jgi:hypothetical protein
LCATAVALAHDQIPSSTCRKASEGKLAVGEAKIGNLSGGNDNTT